MSAHAPTFDDVVPPLLFDLDLERRPHEIAWAEGIDSPAALDALQRAVAADLLAFRQSFGQQAHDWQLEHFHERSLLEARVERLLVLSLDEISEGVADELRTQATHADRRAHGERAADMRRRARALSARAAGVAPLDAQP